MPLYTLFRTDKVYITDGTAKGTKAIAETRAGMQSSFDVYSQVDGRLTFFPTIDGLAAINAETGKISTFLESAFWRDIATYIGSDTWLFGGGQNLLRYTFGSETEIVKSIGAGNVAAFDGRGWFVARDTPTSFALYVTDGTEDGTVPFLLRDEDDARLVRPQIDDEWIIGDRILFIALVTNPAYRSESTALFSTDGTLTGTERLALDLGPVIQLHDFGDRFLFGSFAQQDRVFSIWATDGTKAGTRQVANYDDLAAQAPTDLTVSLLRFRLGRNFFADFADKEYLLVDAGSPRSRENVLIYEIGESGVALRHRIEGISLSSVISSDVTEGSKALRLSMAVSDNGHLFFVRSSSLYAIDLRDGKSFLVKTLNGEGFDVNEFFNIGDKMVFRVGFTGLIAVDTQTLQPTDIIRDGSGLQDFRVVDGLLYWRDSDGIHVTDGTTDGTRTVASNDESGRYFPDLLGPVALDDGVFERLGSLGADDIDLRSSRADERIEAGAGDDRVRTGSGDDRIDGGVGRDTMSGGRGDDVYFVDRTDDVVIERAGGGSDRVLSAADFALPRHVERLTLTGVADLSATGNSRRNTIDGNSGDNLLSGRGGSDVFNGGSGADTIIGGPGADALFGGPGRDLFRFVAASDSARRSRDAIEDFEGAGAARGDRIDLREIDADATRPGDQAFRFGTETGLGRLYLRDVLGDTVVFGNTDRDATAEFALIIADGATRASDYRASDFLL